MDRRTSLQLIAAATLPVAGLCAWAYPNREIKLVVPYPPGGPTDVVGRLVAEKLAQTLGKPVIVDNRAGANGIIGTAAVAQSPADGYTLLLATSATSSNPSIYKTLTFDTEKQFMPVAMAATAPAFVWARASLPADNMQALIALAKAKPGTLSFASGGHGGTPHLCGELLKMLAGIDLLHVPYKGASPAIVDLAAGRVDLYIGSMASALPHYRNGRLKVLGVVEPKRTSLLPNVPTVAEQGLPDYAVVSWFGLFAPAATPEPAVQGLAQAIRQIVAMPDFRASLATAGIEAMTSSPAEFSDFFKHDMALWARVVKEAGVKAE